MTNCSISDWLYVFNNTFCGMNLATVDFWNRILNILNGIMLPSLLMLISYVISALFWLALDSNLAKITDFTLSKFNYIIFTRSKFLPLSSCPLVWDSSSCWISCTALLLCGDLLPCVCLCILLYTALNWFTFPDPLYFLPYAMYQFCGYPVPKYLQFPTNFFSFTLSLFCLFWSSFCLSLLIESNCFVSLTLSNTAFCTVCASTLGPH